MSMHPTRNLFKEFPNRVFVESGSYRGDGIQLAIDAGFKDIYSIDIDETNTKYCMDRFGMRGSNSMGFTEGHLIVVATKDSARDLQSIIETESEPITFWLDAHAQHLEDEPEFPNPYPLLKELEQIGRHPIKRHTIMIDDILHLTHPDITGWTRETIEEALLKINPDYRLSYYANPVRDNILIAHI